eukprot:3182030-Pleurochrysis_carterae.AAC.1
MWKAKRGRRISPTHSSPDCCCVSFPRPVPHTTPGTPCGSIWHAPCWSRAPRSLRYRRSAGGSQTRA